MAKRKTINKNLVGGLTVGGMLLTVSLVFVATLNARERDPAMIAERASRQAEQGELRYAAQMYMRAFNINKEVKYLVEASRCYYRMGEIADCFGMLNIAHSQSPEDVGVLEAWLERQWEFRNMSIDWGMVLERADKLLSVRSDNQLALVARSAALNALQNRDSSLEDEARSALERAIASGPLSPRVVEVRVQRMISEAAGKARNERDPEAARKTLVDARLAAADLVEESIAKNPENDELVVLLGQILIEAEAWDRASTALAAGVEAHPDSPRVHLSRATLSGARARQLIAAGDLDAARPLVEVGLHDLDETIRLEPAMYLAYRLKADIMARQAEVEGRWKPDEPGPRMAILGMFSKALSDTVGIRSLAALLGRSERAQMIFTSFALAMDFANAAPEEQRKSYIEHAQAMLKSARDEFNESILVPVMEGQLAYQARNYRAAIQAYLAAEQRAGALGAAIYIREAMGRLAELYAHTGENGSALRYNEKLATWYVDNGLTPPTRLWLQRAGLLLDLDRAQEGLDQLDMIANEVQADSENDRLHAQLRARALTMVGRTAEAEKEIARAGIGDLQADLMRAGMAAVNTDWETAERLLRGVLQADPTQRRAITMYASVMNSSDRRTEGQEFLRELAAGVSDERLKRVIEAHVILLSRITPEERDAATLELIKTIPEPQERVRETFAFHYGRGNWDEAAGQLDELEKLISDDQDVLLWQFDVNLRRKQFRRAEQYEIKLAQLNADRAGGATFRGQRLREQGDLAASLNEYRAAEQALPSDPAIKTYIAQVLAQMNELDRAIATLDAALDADPTHFQANRMKYLVLESLGRSDEAIEYLLAAKRSNPSDPFIQERALLLEEEEEPAKGIVRRERIREENPDDVQNLFRLVRLYNRVRQTDDALRMVEEIQKIDPGHRPAARWSMNFFGRRGERENAERMIERYREGVTELGQADADMLLAELYEALRDFDAVDAQYRRGIERAIEYERTQSSEDEKRAGFELRVRLMRAFADSLERRERFDDALALHREAKELLKGAEDIDRMNVHLKIVTSLMRKGDLDESQREIAAFRSQFPNEPIIVMPEAQLALLRGELDRARTLLTDLIRVRPQHAWAYYNRGRTNMFLRRFDEARDDFLKAKELSPGGFDFGHRVDLVQVYMINRAWPLAESELRELIAAEPTGTRFPMMLLQMLRGSGQEQRAQEFVATMIARRPNDPFWHYQLGRMLVARSSYSAALPSLERAVELSNNDPMVFAEWLSCLNQAGRPNDVMARTASLDPRLETPAVVTQIAAAEIKLNRRDAARERMVTASANAAGNSVEILYYLCGQIVELFGAQEGYGILESLAQVAEAAELRGRLYIAMARQRTIQGGRDDFSEAARLAALALEQQGVSPRVQIEARVLTAVAATGLDDLATARKQYELVLADDSGNPQALNNLAYLLADKLNQASEAVPFAERVAQIAPNNANVLDTLGWVYFKAGRVEEADGVLRRALAIDPTNLAVMVHLGALYESTGRMREAREYFQQAVDVGGQLGDKSEYLRQATEALARVR